MLLQLLAQSFYKPPSTRPSTNYVSSLSRNIPGRIQNYNEPLNFHCRKVLYVDIFGLGPSEVIIIVGAGLFLYGPDRLKQQLRDSGVKGKIVSAGWRQERADNIKSMIKNAENMRKSRKIKRILESDID